MKTRRLEELIAALRCLPGVGPKSAQRMAYHLLQRDQPGAQRLAARARARARAHPPLRELQQLHRGSRCARCAARRGATRRCCAWSRRPADLLMMEQAQCYQGLYFVLMGALSPLDGVGPREIHLDRLVQARGRRRRARSDPRDQFHRRRRSDGALRRRAAAREGAQGEPHRARAAGRRRARARRQRHARAGRARAARRLRRRWHSATRRSARAAAQAARCVRRRARPPERGAAPRDLARLRAHARTAPPTMRRRRSCTRSWRRRAWARGARWKSGYAKARSRVNGAVASIGTRVVPSDSIRIGTQDRALAAARTGCRACSSITSPKARSCRTTIPEGRASVSSSCRSCAARSGSPSGGSTSTRRGCSSSRRRASSRTA